MPNQMNRDETLAHAQYNSRIGELFVLLNSSDQQVQCRALAMTDWEEIRDSDAVALLASLSPHSNGEVRQLVALQLASIAGSADDPRALQALVTLAADDDPKVRAAAARSSYIANEFSLTPNGKSATSPADRFVDWEQEGETTKLSFRCPNSGTAKRLLAIIAGLCAREMTHPSNEKQTQPPAAKPAELADEPRRLPDVLIDDEPPEIFDLPRRGVVKPVVNVSKGSIRLPDVLIED